MAGPITWQNIRGPDNDGIARGMIAANQLLNSGFDNFNKVINDRAAAQELAIKEASTLQRQNYLDAVQGAADPEALAQLQASGRLNAFTAAMNAADRDAVRGAIDARTAAIRKNITDTRAFNEAEAEYAAKPMVEQAEMLYAQRNAEGLKAYLEANEIPNEHRLWGKLDALGQETLQRQDAATKRTNDAIKMTWDTRDQEHKAKLQPLQLQQTQEQIAASQENRAASKATRETALQEQAYRREDTLMKRVADLAAQGNASTEGTLGSSGTTKEVLETLGKVLPKERVGEVSAFIGKAITENPELAKLPREQALQIITKHAQDLQSGFLGWGNGAALQKLQQSLNIGLVDARPAIAAREATAAANVERMRLAQQELARMRGEPVVEPKAATKEETKPETNKPAETNTNKGNGLGLDAVTKPNAKQDPVVNKVEMEIQKRLYDVERQQMATGQRDELSAESKQYLANRKSADQSAVQDEIENTRKALSGLSEGIETGAAATFDAITSPIAAIKAVNSQGNRLAQALNIPWASEYEEPVSFTPNLDKLRRIREANANLSKKDLEDMRKKIEKELAEARSKK